MGAWNVCTRLLCMKMHSTSGWLNDSTSITWRGDVERLVGGGERPKIACFGRGKIRHRKNTRRRGHTAGAGFRLYDQKKENLGSVA